MERLFAGLINFKEELRPSLKPLFEKLAHGQTPELLLFTCCDSRVVPHLITSGEPGEVFVVRSIGNLVAPADARGQSVGDVSEASAIEYALEVLGIRDIAVCGHSNCGAMAAVQKGRRSFADVAPNLARWLEHGEPALQRVRTMHFDEGLGEVDQLSQANVLVQLDHVATYEPVRKRLRQGEVRLHGLWFDIGHAMVHLHEADKGAFVPLDEAELTRLLTT
ncbi:MAG: carbonic anhydrase [Archangium gephyra]|uniref:carbonic anhydrase n=1 Tax=Archangium gephyra TaxID=48 RepID=A0A2W5ULY8_9BACT|nr:MAG: carbonic anhydrase [Archangium gephyra]